MAAIIFTLAGVLSSQSKPPGSRRDAAGAGIPLSFDVVSITRAQDCAVSRGGPRLGITASPGLLAIRCQTLDFLIRQAYLAGGRDPMLVSPSFYSQALQGAPAWIASELYTIEAKPATPQDRETMLGGMLRSLLEDRCHLRVSWTQRSVPVYELKATGRLKLERAKGTCMSLDDTGALPQGQHYCGAMVRSLSPGSPSVSFYRATMANFCDGLTRLLGREVVDKTGITGTFDVRMYVDRSDMFPLAHRAPEMTDGIPMEPGTSLFSAVTRLGLRLESARGASRFLSIEHIERPAAN
jgi:uncharacterized protein (TIGR03435 family)